MNHIKVRRIYDKLDNCFETNFTGSVIDDNGDVAYYVDGKYHRENGPAVEYADGGKAWYLHGKFHRDGEPACEYANGIKMWYLHGEPHRKDGPAIECTKNPEEWFLYKNQHLFISSSAERRAFIARKTANGNKNNYYPELNKTFWYYNGELISEDPNYTLEAFQKSIIQLQEQRQKR